MQLAELLTKQYGPFMTLKQLATVLHRAPNGLRVSLYADSEWARNVRATRVRQKGCRHVIFDTVRIAGVLGEGSVDAGAKSERGLAGSSQGDCA